MAIDWSVEDGTGLTDANSYVTLAEFRQYWENRGVDYSSPTYTDDTVKVWLIDATSYADLTKQWKGTIITDTQALKIPRIGWYDADGKTLDESVPTQVKNGVCELAAKRQGVDPETSLTTGISSEKYGPVSVNYSGGGSSAGMTKVIYRSANRWFNQVTLPAGKMGVPI